MLLHLLMLLLP